MISDKIAAISVLFLLVIATPVYGCLTQDQASLLANISLYFNASNGTLEEIFNNICQNITEIRNISFNISSNFTNFYNVSETYNSSEIDQKMADLNTSVESQLQGIFSAVNVNAMSIFNNTEQMMDNKLLFYMDTVDDRLSNYKKEFATKESLDNITQNVTSMLWEWEQSIKSRYTTSSMFWMWFAFALIGVLMFFAYLVNKQVPIKKILGSVTGIRRSPVELTTDSEFRKNIENLDSLIFKMIARTQRGFTDDERKKLHDMIMSREITNESDLDAKIKIMESLRPSRKKKP